MGRQKNSIRKEISKMKIFQAFLCALATANPTQVYEVVSEEEALIRNARQYPQDLGQLPANQHQVYEPVSNEEALIRNRRQYGGRSPCETRCYWSHFEKRQICDWWCPRN